MSFLIYTDAFFCQVNLDAFTLDYYIAIASLFAKSDRYQSWSANQQQII
ncbi:hypothetical protein NDI37_21740 [Funiculus sociatus GB2-A5]|uniref:Uncharacterized protein n=1 Tax=Funiculus sociatus GB2-A5 TaxID=2933946 RepID=A0ABV0JUH5_9CYAN|nr:MULTISPECIES: hypothetical protein [unclassified Trichocoleus]MBD1905916.1 hypothetical protein [Trichocoleus sp. FACHB-832]MBD2063478.1 hypothetical protein [Trichocoleus sp. FACHB-6]